MWSFHSLVCNLAIQDFLDKFINIIFNLHATNKLFFDFVFNFSSWPRWSKTKCPRTWTQNIFITSRIGFPYQLSLLSDRLSHEEVFPLVLMRMIADSNFTPDDEVVIWVFVPRPLHNFVVINELKFRVLC